MLTAVPKSWFSWDFRILDGEQTVAEIDLSIWGEKGSLTVERTSYQVHREAWMRGAFVLQANGAVLARAEKPSAFQRSFDIQHAGKRYRLRAGSVFGRSFVLLDGTRELGSVFLEQLFSRRACVELPAELPLPLRIFILWLVLLLWRRAKH
jgi:hypothetical protein